MKRPCFSSIVMFLVSICSTIAIGHAHNFELVGDGAVIARDGANTGFASVIHIPDWILPNDRADSNANYYMYYANHSGKHIYMKWAEILDGPWTAFDLGGIYNGQSRRGVFDTDADPTREDYDHVAGPDAHVDDVNQRIIMYYHGQNQPSTTTPDGTSVPRKHSNFVATSHYGLNFNDPVHAGGETGHGPVSVTYDTVTREVALGQDYQRIFEYKGDYYSVAKRAVMDKAPDPADPWAPKPGDPFDEAWIRENTPTDLWYNDANPNGQSSYHSPAATFLASSEFENHPSNPNPGVAILSNDERMNHTSANLLAAAEQLEIFFYVREDPGDRFDDMYRIVLDISDPDFQNWTVAIDDVTGEYMFDVVVTDEEVKAAVEAAHPGGVDPEFFADPSSLGGPSVFVDDDGSKYIFYTYLSAVLGGNTNTSEGQISAIRLLPPILSDFDFDGWVDRYDLEVLINEWLLSGSDLVADRDNSEKVDLIDFSFFAKDWTGPDSQSPTPNPLTWIVAAAAQGSYTISMTASAATDKSGVEYYFNNITDPTHDSEWQMTTVYIDTDLDPETQYTYRVKARDKSHYQNETAWSATTSATTGPELGPETIFETFDSDPSARGWINDQAGSTTFTYNATGYLDAEIYRDSANTARFYKTLNHNYDETVEFWFEYDAQIVSATSPLQRAFAGLFNYSVSDNHHDLLGARFAYWDYSGTPRENRHDLYCYTTDGTKVSVSGSPLDPGIAYGQNIRVKIHYWFESALGKASLDVYAINTDGSTGSLIMAAPASTVAGTGKTLTLNIMGLGNRTDGSNSGENNVVKIDNMYFSSEAENTSPISPSF